MTRPEGVRCERCCYWWRYASPEVDDEGVAEVGTCRRSCPPVHVAPDDDQEYQWVYSKTDSDFGCGEFRETWPGESP